MTTETIHTCSYECERPACIRAQRDELASRLAAAPPPAAARGDVRGLVELLGQIRDLLASLPVDCLGSDTAADGQPYALRDEVIHGITKALAAESVQAGEVEGYDLAVLDDAAETLDRIGDGSAGLRAARARIAAALSQQPEARGVVDEAMVERAREAYFNAAEVKDGVFTDPVAMRAALTAALTGERNG